MAVNKNFISELHFKGDITITCQQLSTVESERTQTVRPCVSVEWYWPQHCIDGWHWNYYLICYLLNVQTLNLARTHNLKIMLYNKLASKYSLKALNYAESIYIIHILKTQNWWSTVQFLFTGNIVQPTWQMSNADLNGTLCRFQLKSTAFSDDGVLKLENYLWNKF